MDPEAPTSAPTPATPAERRGIRVSVGIALLVFVAIAGGLIWDRHVDAARLEHDPHVVGRVVDLRVLDDEGDDDGTPVTLTVEFTTLAGRTLVVEKHAQMNGRDALRVLGRKEVDVWYRPDDPNDVLLRWDPRGGAR
jgi:hypothetical protein